MRRGAASVVSYAVVATLAVAGVSAGADTTQRAGGAAAPVAAAASVAASARTSGVPVGAAGPPGLQTPLQASHAGCLVSGNGYLRVKFRGALKLDIDLHNSELECDGAARPDGSGIRVSFAGPLRSDGRRLRMVFGIAGTPEGASGRERPTNVTIIFEGEERIFATRGDDKCTTDQVQQERNGALAGPRRSYRVVASGFCIAPVPALNSTTNTDTLSISSFDFAGLVTFEDTP